ncbi:VPLPA-CTERM sorting domain-containing protein [Aliiroseovarius sp. PTFE2010]|uniref:VPLPA-CTERM sorting domain-containing protein n=1 Tax=Aliiroseovarius sp. PTFE2010 TaxID=3417190 RepID=UPI003CF33E97
MRVLISAALVVGAVSSPAMASTVTLDYLGQDPGARNVFFRIDSVSGGASAGQFKFDVVDRSQELLAWCVDITTRLRTDATEYTVDTDMFAPDVTGNLDKLFTQHYAAVTDATSSAAFQTAIWEIVYDTGNFDLYDGRFTLRSKTPDAVETMATSFLALGNAVGGYSVSYLDAGVSAGGAAYSQNLVSVTLSAVPLPASALLLVAGLGALGAARRRV